MLLRSKCSIFHNVKKIQRRPKALVWSKGLNMASPEVISQTFIDHDGTYIDRERFSVERPLKSSLISVHFAKNVLSMKKYNSTINEIS